MINELQEGQSGAIIIDRTPFYAESGGQVGDIGFIVAQNGNARFEVQDTQKQGDAIVHFGVMQSGALKTTDQVHATIDREKPYFSKGKPFCNTFIACSVCMMCWEMMCIKKVLWLMLSVCVFDFNFARALTPDEIRLIENWVNDAILKKPRCGR